MANEEDQTTEDQLPSAKRPISPQEMLGMALISLATPLAGGLMGGKEGAMIGAQAGLKGSGQYLGARSDEAKKEVAADQKHERDMELAQAKPKYMRNAQGQVIDASTGQVVDDSTRDPKVKPVKNAKGQIIDANSGDVIDESTTPPKPDHAASAGGAKGAGPDKNVQATNKNEDTLRKEYTAHPVVKHAQQVETAYAAMQQAKPTAQGDISLIYQYMKMLDPGSVVREGEFATAQNATGIPERVRNTYNNAMKGERLGDDQRKAMLSEAEGLVSAAAEAKGKVAAEYSRIATDRGGKSENVVVDAYKAKPSADDQKALDWAKAESKKPKDQQHKALGGVVDKLKNKGLWHE
jgi:hypothetical protein